MEFDIFIPSLHLAFEYQGSHHYHNHFLYGDKSLQQEKDVQKRIACKENHITLIEVPHWWDGQVNQLRLTIEKYRPDVLLLNVTQLQ